LYCFTSTTHVSGIGLELKLCLILLSVLSSGSLICLAKGGAFLVHRLH
jgi:hypothetical protein